MTNKLFGQETTFSTDQLKSDLTFLKSNLETKHPNLYLYTTKTDLDHIFDSLTNGIIKPLTELEFYRHITVLSSKIKDGHTIILPSQTTTNYHNLNSKFLPYHFIIIDNKLFVDMVCTSENSIANGSEIISINNIGATEIIEQLVNRQVRDGNNSTYPIWILNNYLREYYSYNFGHPNQLVISYKTNSQTQTATINALPKDSINYYRQLKYPSRNIDRKPNEGLTLSVSNEKTYATLTIKDFHNEILKKQYHQNFKKTISKYFEDIQNAGVQNLILDLRNNQGGDIPNGAFLLSYLLDKPFTIIQAYYKVANNTLKETNGQSMGTFKPKDNAFKGKLYILTNGGSFSNSGIVASCLKRNNRGTFIGEETGGNNKVLAGYTKDINLPNTKIQIQIPTKQFLLDKDLPLTGHGTMPDYSIQTNLTDIINSTDNILNYTIELIKQAKKNNGT